MSDTAGKKFLSVLAFLLLAGIVFGLLWFFLIGPKTPVGLGWYLFSFAAGLSMIVLPCTLPLAFVIVPLSMGKGVIRGFLIALFFGIGVSFTLSLYGIFAAILGKVAIGSLGAPLEVVKNWLYFIAGLFAYIFALGELGLVKARMPSYSGAFPGFIQRQQDILKALLLGLFLGNIGVGCPHPATPVILTRIAASGDIFYGWALFFVHAVGRVLPLIFLAILGILGVNALSGLVAHKEKIEKATGWAMVFVASFILVLGLFSHDWWVLSGMHTYLEELTQEERFLSVVSERLNVSAPHVHGLPPADHTGLFGLPLAWGTWAMLFLWILPIVWYYRKTKSQANSLADPEKSIAKATLPYRKWVAILLSILLILVFGYILPERFLMKTQIGHDQNMHGGMMETGMHSGHAAHGATMYHEETDVKEGLVVNFDYAPTPLFAKSPTTLSFLVNQKPDNQPVPESALEVLHEKRMHVNGVRTDLSQFFHIHPTASTPDSSLLSSKYVFGEAGDYKIWSEITYAGTSHVFGHPVVSVAGDMPKSAELKEVTTSRIVKNLLVQIHYNPLSRGANEIAFTIKDSNGRDAELDNYLGEKMHLAIISDDLKNFLHTHPTTHEHSAINLFEQAASLYRTLADAGHDHGTVDGRLNVPGNHVDFSAEFRAPGMYKAFAQFRPKGVSLGPDEFVLAEFWMNIGADRPAVTTLTGTWSLTWWRNLIVSLLLMSLLGYGVKRYITVE